MVSAQQLCQYLTAAETKVRQLGSLGKHSIAPGLKKRKRPKTPPDHIASGDEARYTDQEERALKHIADDDPEYENILMRSSSSE